MKINISELFTYRQYTDAPIAYCFDRKAYRICDAALLGTESEPYQRYIPLLKIDEELIRAAYVRSWGDLHILPAIREGAISFEAYIEREGLQSDWWEYYRSVVFDLEKTWCEENGIGYVFDP